MAALVVFQLLMLTWSVTSACRRNPIIDASTKRFFRASNVSFSSFPLCQSVPWRVTFLSGSTVVAKSGKNRALKLTRPRKLRKKLDIFRHEQNVPPCHMHNIYAYQIHLRVSCYQGPLPCSRYSVTASSGSWDRWHDNAPNEVLYGRIPRKRKNGSKAICFLWWIER